MEFKSAVFNAARDGKVHRLRTYLEHRSEEEILQLVQSKTNGATPLIVACRNGHINVVEYLIEKCGANLEQVGSVTFDGETIDGAPPIWCAAAAGYLPIVKLLVKAGTEVNKTTITNSTPLRAACFDGHFDIVQYLVEHNADIEIANRHGHTSLMIACYKGHTKIVNYLLERGADVNRKSLKGNTALHDCAESGSLEIMQMLLKWGALMDKDSYGLTPLLAAAVTGHTIIVTYLISLPETTKIEKIDALELLGATFVDKKRDMQGALKHWKDAMHFRESDKINVIPKSETTELVPAYGHAVELKTMAQLEEIVEPDEIRMQALLVRERILGSAHPDTSYYIRYRGAVYADMGDFKRCIMLWIYALNMQQKMLDPLSPMTQSCLLSFAELFSFMMTDSPTRPAYPIAFEDMTLILNKAIGELELGMNHLKGTSSTEKDLTNFNRLMIIIMHLISLSCLARHRMSKEELYHFEKIIYKFIRLNPKGMKGFTPLHMACSKDTSVVGRYPVCSFPSVAVVDLLINVGASLNATDLDHNTPLHIACSSQTTKPEVVKLLLDRGAHIDACNIHHKTPIQMLQNITIYDIVSPLNYMSLQCFAARKIIECGIGYKGHIPQKLENFIKLH